MIKVYALLIRKYMDDLQTFGWTMLQNDYDALDRKQDEYTRKMDKLYKRLQREYNFDKYTFYALQDQAVMF